jgi:DNA processing protein
LRKLPHESESAGVPDVLRIEPHDQCWPGLWRHIPDPPEILHIQGDKAWLNRPALAIVGTRRASNRGLAVAEGLARALSLRGWVIVSGLARGVDAAAHRGALSAGGGTVAVMATGPDLIYPRSHSGLHRDVVAQGCSITEHLPGTPPLKHHFPHRNRLIAALARAVIVVEAPLRSGAMHTARVALDYDREVFAVPGPVDLDNSRGCHRLLRDGAHLIESSDDVARILGDPEPKTTDDKPDSGHPDLFHGALDPAPQSSARWIMDRLDLEGVRRDELRLRWPGNEETWVEGLTALELGGLIRRLPGGRIARRIWSCP